MFPDDSNKLNFTPLPDSLIYHQSLNFKVFRFETFALSLFIFVVMFLIIKFDNKPKNSMGSITKPSISFSTNFDAHVKPIIAVDSPAQKKTFVLREKDGFVYRLDWDEHEDPNTIPNVSLIKVVDQQEILVKKLDLQFKPNTTDVNFKVISQLGNSNRVFISQSSSESNQPLQYVINLETGDIFNTDSIIHKIDQSCIGYPFDKLPGNIKEKYLFVCLDKSSGSEELHYLDLNTDQTDKIISLEKNETFNCSPGAYTYGLVYLPVEPASMEIAICASDDHNQIKNVLVPSRYELIEF